VFLLESLAAVVIVRIKQTAAINRVTKESEMTLFIVTSRELFSLALKRAVQAGAAVRVFLF
jgi:hypothetical protein